MGGLMGEHGGRTWGDSSKFDGGGGLKCCQEIPVYELIC